ncbi:hypothetical protein V2J09_013630, partial [Rumex salicifolius]
VPRENLQRSSPPKISALSSPSPPRSSSSGKISGVQTSNATSPITTGYATEHIVIMSKFLSRRASQFGINQFAGEFRRRLYHPLSTFTASSDDHSFHWYLLWRYQILDPNSEIVSIWNYMFLVTSVVALFLDPLLFFLPSVRESVCLDYDKGLLISVTAWRTIADLLYVFHIAMKFRTAFISPSSRVFGRGELVMDPTEIAHRYLKTDFVIVNWIVIPITNTFSTKKMDADTIIFTFTIIVLIQYVPRFFIMFPLQRRIIKTTGVIAKTALVGAGYNLLLYLLASHLLGSIWYTAAISRQFSCWRSECYNERDRFPPCYPNFLDCVSLNDVERQYWLNNTQVLNNCDPANELSSFKFGMFAEAFTSGVGSSVFTTKYLYCLWFGLKNLSSYGQNLQTTVFLGETLFACCICVGGLFLFCLLIGNMQTYLQSLTVRLEEWRIKRRDTDEWMRHRQLPTSLQERVCKFIQYNWLTTRGVNEESILRTLPMDLRREIRRHLCLQLVRRVHFFSQMDEPLLDAICERLLATLTTQGTYIVREGDPVDEMLFIIRGQLESSATDGGRSGFFNSIMLRPGDFAGEELLTWALMPNASQNLPLSTRTVKAVTEVEAFALGYEDLIFFSSQFKRLHSKKLRDTFRYYSHQWRMWSACFIQAAWRKHSRRKLAKELAMEESFDEMYEQDVKDDTGKAQNLGATLLASKFAANTRRSKNHYGEEKASDMVVMPKVMKPNDFSNESEGV